MIGKYFGRYFTYCMMFTGLSLSGAAQAQTMFLESAQINGTAGTIRATRVPVQDAVGNITYKNITLPFTVGATGVVTLNTAGVRITTSPTIVANTFKPGMYRYSSSYHFVVGSPGVGGGGRVTTSIQGQETSFNANWISGPIIGHPHESSLRAAGITSTTQTWGVMGAASSTFSYWDDGDIIGAVQTGTQLILTNYGSDSIPDTSLTFTLCPTANPC